MKSEGGTLTWRDPILDTAGTGDTTMKAVKHNIFGIAMAMMMMGTVGAAIENPVISNIPSCAGDDPVPVLRIGQSQTTDESQTTDDRRLTDDQRLDVCLERCRYTYIYRPHGRSIPGAYQRCRRSCCSRYNRIC